MNGCAIAAAMTIPTPIDYGPLTMLIGTWRGDKGIDVAPDPAGREENPYFETLTFVPVGDVTNANMQVLVALRYHQSVSRKSNNLVFHDQVGYWIWDAAAETVMQSLLIPRAVGVLAGGRWKAGQGPVVLDVTAAADSLDWGIVQAPFMRGNARTVSFRHRLVVDGDALTYDETTVVDIYGKLFEHTDTNALTRG
jgi:methylamine---glutamate N-methyltransferase subunit C